MRPRSHEDAVLCDMPSTRDHAFVSKSSSSPPVSPSQVADGFMQIRRMGMTALATDTRQAGTVAPLWPTFSEGEEAPIRLGPEH